MALPTSVSSSWIQLDHSEEETSSLLSSRPVSTPSSDRALLKPVSVAPSTESLEFLASLSGSPDTLQSITALLPKRSTSPEVERQISTKKNSLELVQPPITTLQHRTSGICSNSTSFKCSTTDAHQHTQVSAVLYSVPLSPEENNALKICSRDIALITQSFISDKQEQPASTAASGVGESLRKPSWDKVILENWSTSTDSNIDCESGNCEGKEVKCRKCGKIVPKVRGCKVAAAPDQKSEKSSRSNSLEKIKRSNSKGEQQVGSKQRRGSKEKMASPMVGGASTSFRRVGGSRNYSAVLSACSRPIKKKGNRRTSVDVLYAREPSEPSIDKIKAKRRLSRQTDVSSFELMTLTEGAEPAENDIAQDSPHRLVVAAEEQTPLTEVLEFQMERIRTANNQLAPTMAGLNGRIQDLRAASSIESCPRAPWNSMETNPSSQDTEDKYINYEPRERLPQEGSVNEDDGKTEDDDYDDDDDDDDEDDAANEPVTGARKKRPETKKHRKNSVRNSRLRRVHEREKGLQDWSTEVVILMALIVYLACRALKFIESLVPPRNKKKK